MEIIKIFNDMFFSNEYFAVVLNNHCIISLHPFYSSVGKLENVEQIAKVTDCLILYVAKGIALGCFVYARCLYKGHGAEKNEEKAINWFKRVSQTGLE